MKKLLLLLIIPLLTFGQIEPSELCDSINTIFTGTGTIPEKSMTFLKIQVTTEYASSYWFPYCGLILRNEIEETIANEELETALNAYGLGPGMMEERMLTVLGDIDFPFNGTLHLANYLFSGSNPEIVCSWPIVINNLNVIELSQNKHLIKKTDILGRDNNKNEGFQLHIYNDGSIERKYVIE
tara:strand:+ start:2069 stop:2617 length:549 start_codon:yes stop_codon:yes gene_type:complete